ncbi:hypothetical protein R3P38DRAFT_3348193 [Favolaschia claudopus]|uniref:Uncharacterized protein n=1 Tax=Favolaschia claudopus TaxID=2862362 RepID=A0AAW0CSJ4_9AGAR
MSDDFGPIVSFYSSGLGGVLDCENYPSKIGSTVEVMLRVVFSVCTDRGSPMNVVLRPVLRPYFAWCFVFVLRFGIQMKASGDFLLRMQYGFDLLYVLFLPNTANMSVPTRRNYPPPHPISGVLQIPRRNYVSFVIRRTYANFNRARARAFCFMFYQFKLMINSSGSTTLAHEPYPSSTDSFQTYSTQVHLVQIIEYFISSTSKVHTLHTLPPAHKPRPFPLTRFQPILLKVLPRPTEPKRSTARRLVVRRKGSRRDCANRFEISEVNSNSRLTGRRWTAHPSKRGESGSSGGGEFRSVG